MDTAPFDARIQEANERLAKAREAAKAALDELAEALGRFARQWIDARVESTIRAKPSEIKVLGVEGLRPLKAEVEALKGRVPELVQREFASRFPRQFEGRVEPPDRFGSNPYGVHSHRPPKEFDDALRHVVGDLGVILSSRELADSAAWRDGRYAQSFDWDRDALAAAQAFGDAYQEFLIASRELTQAENDKSQAQAEDLWRNA